MSKFNRSRDGNRRFSYESLETRQMMAGDIHAAFSGDVLILSESLGTPETAQAVQVSQVNGRLRIEGLVSSTGSQTTINGKTSVDFAIPKTLSISLGGGSDEVTVQNLSLGGSLAINTAAKPTTTFADNDKVSVFRVTAAGNLTINTGAGHDHVSVNQSRIGNGAAGVGNLNIFTSALHAAGETDRDAVSLGTTTVRGKTHIETGVSADQVLVFGSTLGDAASEATEIFTGAGADSVTFGFLAVDSSLPVFVAGNLDIRTMASLTSTSDQDVDTVKLLDTTVQESLFVKLGAGNDKLDLENVTAFKQVLLEGQGGNDTMKLVDIEAGDGFFALLGSGDDLLDLVGLRTNRMSIVGSDGFDRLFKFGVSDIPSTSVSITGIEETNGLRLITTAPTRT